MEILRHFLSILHPSGSHTQGIEVIDGQVIYPDSLTSGEPKELDLLPSPTKCVDNKLTLSTLLTHKNLQPLKKGFVPIGISRKSEDLVQSSWKRMTTGVIAGRRNFGKSNIIKFFILLALHARKTGLKCKIHFGDPHHNLPDATGTFFKPILDQFDNVFLGLESLKEGKHLIFFHELLEYVQSFQEGGFDESAPWHLIFIDEADLFFQEKEHGKKTYSIIRDLVNLRKGRIFFLMSFADTTKAGSGNIGTSLVAAGTTVLCVNYDLTRARMVLQGQDEARKVINLPIGYAAVKIPDSKVQVCQMPYVNEEDLKPFIATTPVEKLASESEQPEHITLQDGEIIRKEQITGWDRIFGGFTYTPLGSHSLIYVPKSLISEAQIEDELQHLAEFDEPESEPKPISTLTEPIKEFFIEKESQSMPISDYLTDANQADFDAFLTYLDPKLSKRSMADYGQDLKLWQRLLNGDVTPDNIQKILETFEYARAIRMRTTLFNYGQYRLTVGDPSIAAVLARIQHDPQKSKPETKKTLSEKEIEMYHTIARKLCNEQNRVGIWIELCLLGIKPSQIEQLKILNKSTVQDNKHKIKIPDWLYHAFSQIAEKEWRLSRKTIYKEVIQYETNPSMLNTAAHSRSNLDSLREP